MFTIKARNVHQALPEAARLLVSNMVSRPSRNGPVVQFTGPLSTEYTRPNERVLFWNARDANPFFHLFEALWMLAGRNDVAFPARFAKQLAQYSDDGVTFNGAYGFRWRAHFGRDQLVDIGNALWRDPTCRRQVLTMWDGRRDLGMASKDLPCNVTAFLQLNAQGELDLMVCNRSNDMIWGCYGANAVHFSVLLEYMAARIQRPVGRYHQVSMNTHVYQDRHGAMLHALAEEAPDIRPRPCPYELEQVAPVPLVSTPISEWDRDLYLLLSSGSNYTFQDPFFEHVAKPLMRAHTRYSADTPNRYADARGELEACQATDWKRAATEWINRRERNSLYQMAAGR